MANGQSPLGQLLQSIASSSTASTANNSQLLAELSRPGHSHLAQVVSVANSQIVLQLGRQQLTLNSQALPTAIQQQLQQGARELLLFNPPANTQKLSQGPSQQADIRLWLLPLKAAQDGQLQLMNRQQPLVNWQLNERQQLIFQQGSTTVELPRRLPPMVANFLASHGSLKLEFALTQPSATRQEPQLVVSLHSAKPSYQVPPRAQIPQLTMPLASPLAQQLLKFSEQGVSRLALEQLLQSMRQPSGFIAPLPGHEQTLDATRLLQGRAASPQQVMQRLTELLQNAPPTRDVNNTALAQSIKVLAEQYSISSAATAAPARPASVAASAAQADVELQQLLTQLLAKSPQAEQLAQQPQALQHWVSQWFAARPLALQSAQQLGGLGQALLLLLGARLQQQQPQGGTQQWLQQLQQWLQPASNSAAKATNTALNSAPPTTEMNSPLAQASSSLVSRLLQTLGSAFASAQLSQARLQESSANQQPDYYILLPPAAQQNKQDELLIQRRKDRRRDRQQQDIWLFTLRLDTQRLGVIMAKGRYQQGHAQIDFYTNNGATQQQLETHLAVLQGRLQAQQVNQVDFSVQAGEIPESLAEQASGVIRVSV